MAIMRIGTDLSGVIIQGGGVKYQRGFKSSKDLYVPGALECLHYVGKVYGAQNILIISQIDTHEGAAQVRQWLNMSHFHESTGIPARNLRFCRGRSEKRGLCLNLQIQFYIDDRLECAGPAAEVVDQAILFNPRPIEVLKKQNEAYIPMLACGRIKCAKNWDQVAQLLLD